MDIAHTHVYMLSSAHNTMHVHALASGAIMCGVCTCVLEPEPPVTRARGQGEPEMQGK